MSTFPCPCGGSCACHGGGAFPPPCDVVGGCGSVVPTAAPPADRCRRDRNCLAAEKADDQLVGAVCDQPLCRSCVEGVESALRDAPRLYVQLRQLLRVAGSSSSGEQVTRSKGHPLPINAGALDLTEQLHWLTTTWADEVITAAARPASDRASQPEAQQVDDACFLLRTYLQRWVRHPDVEVNVTRTETIVQCGAQAAGLLLDWKRIARRRLGLADLTHRPPEPCPACNVEGVLERRDGDDKVRCTNCGKAWTLKMYETFVHAWVGSGPSAPAPTPTLGRRGPETAADGQDARRGSAAHSWTGAA